MQAPVRIVDTEALAQRIEAVALAGEHLARQRQRIDHIAMHIGTARQFGAREFLVEEGEVERRVVDHPLCVAREVDELGGDVAKLRLTLEIFPRHPVNLGRAEVDLALGVETKVDGAAGRAPVDDFQAGELDDAVALLGREPRGLGVDDQLTHCSCYRR